MSSIFKRKLQFAISLLRSGNIVLVWEAFRRRLGSEEIAIGFRRDLEKEFAEPKSLMKISVRKAIPEDAKYFQDRRNDGLIERFETCYVALTKEGIPCSRLWLIDASQNELLKDTWNATFPELQPDEVLIENVYTVPKYRGFGILPLVVDKVVKAGRKSGIRYALTFGELKNTITSRSFAYAGFDPYILRRKRWTLFIRRISFENVPADILEQYEKDTALYRQKREL